MFTPTTFGFLSSKVVPLYVPTFRRAILRNTFRNNPASRFGALLSFKEYSSKKFTKDHEWIDVENDLGTIGITDYAQKALGDVVYVETPEIGTVVEQSGPCGAVESVKAASDIYAPVSGEIVDVNKNLVETPGLINKSPETDGWLCKIKLSNPSELNSLMEEHEYHSHCEKSH
ncbi:glycine cleavage system H protein [Gigaspora rosea]|uniref:Glycine cleavage system H protein n=1 Tax=Gigaspora rosea TaxID=44941 RepID=A0A397UD40_9GLOM|nr:glycine cleavage system H protein [Gigaspora rosea]